MASRPRGGRWRLAGGLVGVLLVVSNCGGGGGSSALPRAEGLIAKDVASSAGIAQDILSWGAPVGDIDGDRKPDFILVRHLTEAISIYRNLGGMRFAKVTTNHFTPKDRHWCSFGDVNGDALTDIFCALGADRGTGSKLNELWLHTSGSGFGFTESAARYGVTDRYGRGRYNALADVDKDGRLDLFVTNAAPRVDGRASPNRLFMNVDGTHFRDSPGLGLDVETGSFCLRATDVDLDGDVDFLVCGNHELLLYRNDGGRRFVEIGHERGLLPVPKGVSTEAKPPGARPYWRSAELTDLNKDGILDIAAVAKDAVVVQFGTTDGFGDPIRVSRMKFGFDIAVGDVDEDGDPDLYVLQTCLKKSEKESDGPDLPDSIFVNGGDGKHWSELAVPSAGRGCGDSVDAIDADGDGTTEFIVLNGRDAIRGPVQLITIRRSR
jgi:VCBS repeat protein